MDSNSNGEMKQILNILETLVEGFARLEANQVETNRRLDSIEERQDRFEERQDRFEERQISFEEQQINFEKRQANFEERQASFEEIITDIRHRIILMENEFGKKIGLLLDGHVLMAEKLDPLPEAVEKLQEDVSIIKKVLVKHSGDINELKSVI